jgi:hypothetical protein
MTVMLSPELESLVAKRARAEGISVEAYVERLVREATAQAPPEDALLPEWPGRVLGDLRREDLCDDAR